jgi:hypothetical protein
MTVLLITTRHLELRRETRVLVDDNDNPISEPELVSLCSCGAEVATPKRSWGDHLPPRFPHELRWERHKIATIGVKLETASWR